MNYLEFCVFVNHFSHKHDDWSDGGFFSLHMLHCNLHFKEQRCYFVRGLKLKSKKQAFNGPLWFALSCHENQLAS